MGSCVCCGANDWRYEASLPTFLFIHESAILIGRVCGLGRTTPEPTVTIDYYEENKKLYPEFISRATR